MSLRSFSGPIPQPDVSRGALPQLPVPASAPPTSNFPLGSILAPQALAPQIAIPYFGPHPADLSTVPMAIPIHGFWPATPGYLYAPCFRSLTSIGPTLQDRSRAHTVRVTAPTSWQLWAKPCLMQPYSVLPWTGSTPSWLLPGSEQCRRPKCRERGNHLNHSHDSCRFKDASTRHHNLGRAPEKKVKHASSSSGGKNKTQTYKPKPTAPQASSGATPTRKRLCYI